MINLIPPEGHKVVRREYRLRAIASALFLFGFVFLFLAAALIPTYILVESQINSFEREAEKEMVKDDGLAAAEHEVSETRDILKQLKTSSTTATITNSKAIEEIAKQAPPGIIFRMFSTEGVRGSIKKVNVQGIAPTREALANFKDSIEASIFFDTAEVPISDLARDINLPFSISITLASST